MDKILLTGGKGFFASRYYEYYRDKYDIISLKREDLDITNENKVIEVVKNINPKFIIHTAAIADTMVCENNKDLSYTINVEGSKNVAKAAEMVKSKLIYLSSEQIFNGNAESGPYSEKTIPNPNTVYGKHKLLAEKEINNFIDHVWILRFTWLFGFPERCGKVNPNIVWNVLKASIKGEKVKFPANEYRGMTYVYNLLQNFDQIFNIPYGIYNTGSENNLSTYDIARIVLEEMGLGHKINDIIIKDEEKFKNTPRDIRISNLKLKGNGIEFLETKEAVKKCIKDFGYIIR